MTVHPADLQKPGFATGGIRLWVQVAILLVLIAAAYRYTFELLWTVWMNNPNYSHGVLVPAVSAGLIWLNRTKLAGLPLSPSAFGLPVIGFALVVLLSGLRGDVLILQGDSLILLLAGLVLHFAGWQWFRHLAFPIAYLIFMVPFLPLFQNQVSFRLKQLAATGAVTVSGWLGMLVGRDGMSLYLPSGVLRIENACSGMQSLISLMALGAIFAYLAQGAWPKRVLLFLFSIPIALLVNVIRISALCVVGTATDTETASGMFHDVSGFVLFGVGFLMLLGVKKVLRC